MGYFDGLFLSPNCVYSQMVADGINGIFIFSFFYSVLIFQSLYFFYCLYFYFLSNELDAYSRHISSCVWLKLEAARWWIFCTWQFCTRLPISWIPPRCRKSHSPSDDEAHTHQYPYFLLFSVVRGRNGENSVYDCTACGCEVPVSGISSISSSLLGRYGGRW